MLALSALELVRCELMHINSMEDTTENWSRCWANVQGPCTLAGEKLCWLGVHLSPRRWR